MKKTIFAVSMLLFLILSACGSDPREESPTVNHLMEFNEEVNERRTESDGDSGEKKLTSDTSEMEDFMIASYEILEEEFSKDFYVYIDIFDESLSNDILKTTAYSAILVARPDSEVADLFKQHIDGEENNSEWTILKQEVNESIYDVLYKDLEADEKISVYIYDPYMYDPPILIAFPTIRNEVIECMNVAC